MVYHQSHLNPLGLIRELSVRRRIGVRRAKLDRRLVHQALLECQHSLQDRRQDPGDQEYAELASHEQLQLSLAGLPRPSGDSATSTSLILRRPRLIPWFQREVGGTGLPKRFGNWHTICTRMNRWSKSGVLDRVFERLQEAKIVRIKIEAVSLDSTIVRVHPDGTGALRKNGPQAIG